MSSSVAICSFFPASSNIAGSETALSGIFTYTFSHGSADILSFLRVNGPKGMVRLKKASYVAGGFLFRGLLYLPCCSPSHGRRTDQSPGGGAVPEKDDRLDSPPAGLVGVVGHGSPHTLYFDGNPAASSNRPSSFGNSAFFDMSSSRYKFCALICYKERY